MADDQAAPLPDTAVKATLDDPLCMHCRQAVTPCYCQADGDCSHNGWKHIRADTHECPGMPTGAYPSSQSLRDRLRADCPGIAPEAVMAFRTGMGSWYADSISDQAIGRGLAAAAPALRAQDRERVREHILNRMRQLDPFADKPAITELRILAEELGWTGGNGD